MATLLRNITLSVCLMLTPACQSLETMLYGAGGAAAGSVVGPGGAAAGAAVGIGASQLQQAERANVDLKKQAQQNIAAQIPQSPWQAFVSSLSALLHTLGWWYVIIFILVPLVTKRGRAWAKNFISLSDTASKKEVDEYTNRLNKLEGMISTLDKEQEQ